MIEKIKKDFIDAMKNKNIKKKTLLWLIKSEIDLIEKERKATDADAIKSIKKLLKWINDSLNYKKEDTDLLNEKEILEKYLPKELSKDEIIKILNENFKENNNIWLIMKYFKENYEWRIDNSLLITIIKNK